MDDELIADLIESVREQRARYDALLKSTGRTRAGGCGSVSGRAGIGRTGSGLTPAVIKQAGRRYGMRLGEAFRVEM